MNNNNNKYSRLSFLRLSAMAGAAISINPLLSFAEALSAPALDNSLVADGKKIGIIGLDTSHSEVFTKMINSGEVGGGYKVVAAYPHGSPDIPEALKMKPGIIAAVKNMGVEIVDSIDVLLKKVDVVLLETIDGRPHYQQALPVLKAGKRMFIDKPVSASLAEAQRIFEASRKYNSPVFSSSALRFDPTVQKVVSGSIGAVTGADVYTPAVIEPHHLDMAWYGIHGCEMLFTIMGAGCESVSRTHQAGTDLIVGTWKDGRIGTVRGIRRGASNIAGTAFGEKGIASLGPFSSYAPLVNKIISFFDTGMPPVSAAETLEIFAFMHAADLSKKENGKSILIKL